MHRFELSLANDRIWQINELIKFLISHIDQDILISVNPEAHDLAHCGIYDLLENFKFRSVSIETSNCLEKHDRYRILKRPLDLFLISSYWKDYDLTSSGHWDASKIFGVFYGRPSANRIGIASYLLQHHAEQSIVIFAANIDDPDARRLFDVDTLFQYRPHSIIEFGHMISRKHHANISYTGFGHAYDPCTSMHHCYRSIMIDIISEPNIQGRTFYPTEKFSRCVLMKKPFIAMASANYLGYLRQMGFKTFDAYWEENYDGFACENRYERILALIDQISRMSPGDLASMYQDMTSTLQHNYHLLVSQTYSTNVKEIK